MQADAILRMTLGQLVNLEQEKLGGRARRAARRRSPSTCGFSRTTRTSCAIIRDDLLEIETKYGDERRTEISGEEIGSVDLEDLITEETMVVSISHKGYIKRTPASVYRAQRRGGKGLKGAETEDEDPIEHLFVASTHDYLLFFTNRGKVYWQKVYDLPQLSRDSRGRAIVNLLNLAEGEKIAECLAIRDFDEPGHFLMMATRKGLVKKTPLEQYSRPKKRRHHRHQAPRRRRAGRRRRRRAGRRDHRLHGARARPFASARPTSARSGRDAQGVHGIKLRSGDDVVGMVVADPDATLLTVCENGYGKRTPIGPNSRRRRDRRRTKSAAEEAADAAGDRSRAGDDEEGERFDVAAAIPRKGRGAMGVRDIKTTDRNGPVIGIDGRPRRPTNC